MSKQYVSLLISIMPTEGTPSTKCPFLPFSVIQPCFNTVILTFFVAAWYLSVSAELMVIKASPQDLIVTFPVVLPTVVTA